jgi:hypothetical protein
MRPARNCRHCGVDISWRHCLAKQCLDCTQSVTGAAAAHRAVYAAIRRGQLAAPRFLQCVDCGRQATDYDHRDYREPLNVQPVCRGCNLARGPAIPVTYREAA